MREQRFAHWWECLHIYGSYTYVLLLHSITAANASHIFTYIVERTGFWSWEDLRKTKFSKTYSSFVLWLLILKRNGKFNRVPINIQLQTFDYVSQIMWFVEKLLTVWVFNWQHVFNTELTLTKCLQFLKFKIYILLILMWKLSTIKNMCACISGWFLRAPMRCAIHTLYIVDVLHDDDDAMGSSTHTVHDFVLMTTFYWIVTAVLL